MMDYNYPLDYTWSTEDIIDVMSLYNAVEKAYEEGISKTDFLNAYRKFKNVVGTKSEEKQIDKEFQDVSGYSIYKVFKASQENDWMTKRIKAFFRKKGADKPIFFAVFVLICLGIVMIGSASIGAVSSKGTAFAIKNMITQSIYVAIGVFIMMVLTKGFKLKMINYRSSMAVYIMGIISMCGCVFWTTKGSHAWIHLGSFTVQPAEFMKIGMVLILSYMLTETDSAFVVKGKFRTAELKSKFYKDKFNKCVLFPLALMVFAFGIGVIVQKDLGSSLILAAICFICFMSTPRDYYKKYKKLVWIALAVAVIILGFLITAVLQGYQLQRIDSWLKPLKIENIYDSSWQLVNSLIAFTDGGIFGLGLGNSIQKYDYIPEAHNDFIGAIIYEELGIFGLALMIIPTAIIIFRLLKYADQIQNNKSRVILIGIASYFMLHLFVNLGGVSGLIPMTGVPLLLVSSGGSSTIAALIAIGIAQAIISKFNKEQLEKTDTQL